MAAIIVDDLGRDYFVNKVKTDPDMPSLKQELDNLRLPSGMSLWTKS